MVGEDVDDDVGLEVDGEGDAINVLAFIADKFFGYSGEVLSQFLISFGFLVLLQSFGKGKHLLKKQIDMLRIVG